MSLEHLSTEQVLLVLGIKGKAFETRISNLLISQLHDGLVSDSLHPEKVVEEVLALEGLAASKTKRESQFTQDPLLKGLWHKHYMQAKYISRNCLNEIRHRLPSLIREIGANSKSHEEFAALIAHEASIVAYEKRHSKGKLTGEWIVFAKHCGKNYYLTLARHDDPPETIKKRAVDDCALQFPFLFV